MAQRLVIFHQNFDILCLVFQIIDWLSALLDSHVQQLRLAEDAVDVILPLYDQVTAMVNI